MPSVDCLNLDFYQSHITAFLGHNGAGKTTTISILTGLFPPTSGTAYILNHDIRYDMEKIRKFVGLCPQHNILYDQLTVEDHINFYGRLSRMTADDIRITLPAILDDVGLTMKRKAQIKELSGGMKRKLNVAIAFLGDSKVVFLDEPTAGVDPNSRRGIWDLLLKYRRSDKTIILTTHQMDEADYLCDRIAIISKGKLKCCGSSVFLKSLHGSGYYLRLLKSVNAQKESFSENECSSSGLKLFLFIKELISKVEFDNETRLQWTVILPYTSFSDNGFSNLFKKLDNSLEALNVSSYGLSDTSLEEVFLKVAFDPSEPKNTVKCLKINPDDSNQPFEAIVNPFKNNNTTVYESNISIKLARGFPLLGQQLFAMLLKRLHYAKRDVKGLLFEIVFPVMIVIIFIFLLRFGGQKSKERSEVIYPWLMTSTDASVKMNTFYKKEETQNELQERITNTFTSDLGESGVRCMNTSVFSIKELPCSFTPDRPWTKSINTTLSATTCDCEYNGYQTCSNPSIGRPTNSYREMASSDILHNLTGYNLSEHLMKTFDTYAQTQYGGYQFLMPNYFGLSCRLLGNSSIWNSLLNKIDSRYENSNLFINELRQFFTLSGQRTTFSRVWINTRGHFAMPAYLNIFSNVLLRSHINSTKNLYNYGILVASKPFRYSEPVAEDDIKQKSFLEVILAVFLIIALSIIPASFVLFVIDESQAGSKRQQFITGLNPFVYWISNFLFDALKYSISVSCLVLLLLLFDYQSYIGPKNRDAFLTILCGYGMCIIPHMYVLSLLFSTPSVALIALSTYNMLIGTITTLTTVILDMMLQHNPSLQSTNDLLKNLFLIFPQFCLGRGVMHLSVNHLKFKALKSINNYEPFDWNITGKLLVSLFTAFVSWSLVMYLIESGVIGSILKIKQQSVTTRDLDPHEDVPDEGERLVTDIDDEDVLKVRNLTKIYGFFNSCKRLSSCLLKSNVPSIAVNNVTFGVRKGECFGLLGVNGAGKTTIFKMLTGEESVTSGDAMINNQSIIRNIGASHKNIGFCPQFDALHSLLTCEEELYLYSRIRGIPWSLINKTVNSSIEGLSLTSYAKETTEKLSGGNKRKLSAAISFIGGPSVVFMDEPTSGMDSGARRFLWNKIRQLIKQGRTVILTSHNMEECEVLCDRVAIMVNGSFQCLGSVQHLKSQFGDKYFVTVMLHKNREKTNEREIIKEILINKFHTGLTIKDENLVSIQYIIDPLCFKLWEIFEFFENLKITDVVFDYSVSQTTLDDIFIDFAKKCNVADLLATTSSKKAV